MRTTHFIGIDEKHHFKIILYIYILKNQNKLLVNHVVNQNLISKENHSIHHYCFFV